MSLVGFVIRRKSLYRIELSICCGLHTIDNCGTLFTASECFSNHDPTLVAFDESPVNGCMWGFIKIPANSFPRQILHLHTVFVRISTLWGYNWLNKWWHCSIAKKKINYCVDCFGSCAIILSASLVLAIPGFHFYPSNNTNSMNEFVSCFIHLEDRHWCAGNIILCSRVEEFSISEGTIPQSSAWSSLLVRLVGFSIFFSTI